MKRVPCPAISRFKSSKLWGLARLTVRDSAASVSALSAPLLNRFQRMVAMTKLDVRLLPLPCDRIVRPEPRIDLRMVGRLLPVPSRRVPPDVRKIRLQLGVPFSAAFICVRGRPNIPSSFRNIYFHQTTGAQASPVDRIWSFGFAQQASASVGVDMAREGGLPSGSVVRRGCPRFRRSRCEARISYAVRHIFLCGLSFTPCVVPRMAMRPSRPNEVALSNNRGIPSIQRWLLQYGHTAAGGEAVPEGWVGNAHAALAAVTLIEP